MRNAFADAMRQAHAVERLFQAQNTHTAQQAAKSVARKRRPAEGPSPQQAQWMAELKPKGTAASRAAGQAVPKNTTALSVADREEMWELFQDLDQDNSGSLEAPEFARLAESLGRRLSEREVNAAMAEMDGDGSGAIDYDEFCEWWAKNKNGVGRWVGMVKDRARERAWAAETKRRIADAEAQPEEVVVPLLAVEAFNAILRHLQERKLKMADLFAMMDRDGGGEIEIDELGATLQWLGLQLSPEALESVIESLDVDGGGTVDREEFFVRIRAISRQRRKAFSASDRAFTAPAPSGTRRGRPGSAVGTFRFHLLPGTIDQRSTTSLQDLGRMSRSSYDVVGSLPPYRRNTGPK
jgi:Ca2+-binding EF-hand superfamily protein